MYVHLLRPKVEAFETPKYYHFFCFISKYKFQFYILAHLELVNFCMNHTAKLKAYAYNHDSALLTSLACIRLSCLLLPPPPMYRIKSLRPLGTCLFLTGGGQKIRPFQEKKSELTLPCPTWRGSELTRTCVIHCQSS